MMDNALVVTRTRLPQRTKSSCFRDVFELFHNGIQQCLWWFRNACRMRESRSSTWLTVTKVSMHPKFVRKSILKVLMPGTPCVTSCIYTSESCTRFSRLTSRKWRLFGHHEKKQLVDSSRLKVLHRLRQQNRNSNGLRCTRKFQEILSRAATSHCGILLASLYHKSRVEVRIFARQNPSCANNFELWKKETTTFAIHPVSVAMSPCVPPIPPLTCNNR